MKPTVYLETTIPSYLTGRPSRDKVISGNQEATRRWWNQDRANFSLYVSEVVLMEAADGDPLLARARMNALTDIPLLPLTGAAEKLALSLRKRLAMPDKAAVDALHVALAAVYGLSFLLTWNCRHINNPFQLPKIEAACRAAGYPPPVICTPFDLLNLQPDSVP